jgi:hypothetical protein
MDAAAEVPLKTGARLPGGLADREVGRDEECGRNATKAAALLAIGAKGRGVRFGD